MSEKQCDLLKNGGGGSIGELSDVNTTSVANGEVLGYNSSTQEWSGVKVNKQLYAGVTYSKALTFTAGASGLYWNYYLKWLAGQINSMLDSLPNGLYCEFLNMLGCVSVSPVLISTTGSSHAYIGTAMVRTMAADNSYISDTVYRLDASDAAKCHYDSVVYNPSTNAVSVNKYDSTLAIQPNETRTVSVYFRLHSPSSILPTS